MIGIINVVVVIVIVVFGAAVVTVDGVFSGDEWIEIVEPADIIGIILLNDSVHVTIATICCASARTNTAESIEIVRTFGVRIMRIRIISKPN